MAMTRVTAADGQIVKSSAGWAKFAKHWTLIEAASMSAMPPNSRSACARRPPRSGGCPGHFPKILIPKRSSRRLPTGCWQAKPFTFSHPGEIPEDMPDARFFVERYGPKAS